MLGEAIRCYAQPTAFCGEYVIKAARGPCLNPDPKVCDELSHDRHVNTCFSSREECEDWCSKGEPCISQPLCRESRPEQY